MRTLDEFYGYSTCQLMEACNSLAVESGRIVHHLVRRCDIQLAAEPVCVLDSACLVSGKPLVIGASVSSTAKRS